MVNAANNSRALFLKLYAGEVMTAFQTKNIMMNYSRVRNIKSGKSAQFIMTGKHRTAAYHTPGNEIIPDAAAKHSERVVTIDDLLIVHQFIPNIDEAMAHYDIRSVYTQEAAYGLAKAADQNILRTAIKAALTTNKERAGKLVQDYNAWDDEDFSANVVYSSTNFANSLKSSNFFEGVLEAKRILESAGAPLDDLVCIVSTDLFYEMFKAGSNSEATTSLHMFNTDIGGKGSIVDANMPNIAGIPVVRTPHMGNGTRSTWTDSLWSTGTTTGAAPLGAAESNRAAVYDLPANYTAASGGANLVGPTGGTDANGATVALRTEGTKVRALVMNRDAVATVKLLDLSVETDYMVNRQGTLIVSKYAMGHNVLRPAMAVALSSSHIA
tara:strand:+ start:135 stop:1283 length:1149 start_codon:yes stop_codon:yes gene_type:complete